MSGLRLSDLNKETTYLLTLRLDGPPGVIILTSHDTGWAHTADRSSLSLACLSGTLYRSSSVIRTIV